jgi:RHS repeat-associated protein
VQNQAVTGSPITQYVYDGLGARIAKGTLSAPPAPYTPISANLASSPTCAPPFSSGFTLTTRYLVDQGGDQVTEMSEQNGEVWAHSNVFSAARLTATYDVNGGNGGLHYALADPLGTKRVQANISGQTEMSWISLPFGDALTPIAPPNPPLTADDATEHHFTQKERDNESGNDYFFARYYNSAIGRFTTPDWSAKTEPVPYAVFTDPQSLNLYAYVRNNPITHVDLDGHECQPGQVACQAMEALHKAEGIVQNRVSLLAAAAQAYAKGDFGPLPPKSLAGPPKAPGAPIWHWKQKTGSMDRMIDGIVVDHAGTGFSGNGKGKNNPLAEDQGDAYNPNWGPTPAGKYIIGKAYTNAKTGPISINLTPEDPNSVYSRGPFLIHGGVKSEGCQVLNPKDGLNPRLIIDGSGTREEVVDHQ